MNWFYIKVINIVVTLNLFASFYASFLRLGPSLLFCIAFYLVSALTTIAAAKVIAIMEIYHLLKQKSETINIFGRAINMVSI